MRARVLFFGPLQDVTGRAAEEFEFSPGADMGVLFDHYAARWPRLGEMAASVAMARNRRFAKRTERLEDGDEVALLPPVSGGSGDGHFTLTRWPIDVRKLVARVETGAEGAVVTFEGTVRNRTGARKVLCMDYDAYEPMALATLEEIGREVTREFQLTGLAIAHRLGRLLVGETSVAIVAAAPHRPAAFAAAAAAIDRVKKRVPVWKRENFEQGAAWVEGEWDSDVPTARP
jgi:molybdopterin synthase catalytic subunit